MNNGPLYLAIIVAVVLMIFLWSNLRNFDLKTIASLSVLRFLQRIRTHIEDFNAGKEVSGPLQETRKAAEKFTGDTKTLLTDLVDGIKSVLAGGFNALGTVVGKIQNFATTAPAVIQEEAQKHIQALTTATQKIQQGQVAPLKVTM